MFVESFFASRDDLLLYLFRHGAGMAPELPVLPLLILYIIPAVHYYMNLTEEDDYEG